MADTGPPWNLRFPGPQDFVRETNFYIEDLAEDVAAGLSAAGNAGIGPNLVSVVKSDVFNTTSETFVEIPGLAATITPTSADSKILVVVSVTSSTSSTVASVFNVVRDSTALFVGDADGSRVRATFRGNAASGSTNTVVFLDEPNTDDPVTYTVETARMTPSTGTTRINRSNADNDDGNLSNGRTSSFITLIEVAA